MFKKPMFWFGSLCAAFIAFAVWSGAQSVSTSGTLAPPATPASFVSTAPASGAAADNQTRPARDRGNFIFRMLQ
jgi:hypothetical protein